MAYGLMLAHERMECLPSWTCASCQAGPRAAFDQQVAWGESHAVAFCNTVLGARTNRYGDFMDIACAITGRAPYSGLQIAENRHAQLVVDIRSLPVRCQSDDIFYPVPGALVGRLAGVRISAVIGLSHQVSEDLLKALCAGVTAAGAVDLIHVVGFTPDPPDLAGKGSLFGGCKRDSAAV